MRATGWRWPIRCFVELRYDNYHCAENELCIVSSAPSFRLTKFASIFMESRELCLLGKIRTGRLRFESKLNRNGHGRNNNPIQP